MKRIVRNQKLTPREAARLRTVRAEFDHKPSKAQLLTSGNYTGPMSLEEYFAWRKRMSDAPLSQQLKAAIESCGQTLYAISQASGVSAPVLQRFMNGERGITLETAGKLAVYLGLSLLPDPAKKRAS
jgi:hypothetical protein